MKRFLCWALGALLWTSAPVMGAGTVEVSYDRDRDQIAIQAKDASLSQLFAQLAQKAGIASRIDAAVAGDLVNVNQPMRPTAEVFQYLLNRYSYALQYHGAAKAPGRVSAVTIVGLAGRASGSASLLPVQQGPGAQVHGAPRETAGSALARTPPDLYQQHRNAAAPGMATTAGGADAALPPMPGGGSGTDGR